MKLQDLVTAIDKQRQHSNLSSAIRLFVLDFCRSRASDIEAEVNLHEMLLANSTLVGTIEARQRISRPAPTNRQFETVEVRPCVTCVPPKS